MTPEPPFTRRQKDFLRRLLSSAGPLPRDQWPSPVVFRRWLRNDDFKHALCEIRAAHRFQADFHLDGACTQAAANLESHFAAAADARDPADTDPRPLLHTLRLSHLRQRFEPEPLIDDSKPFLLPWFETIEDQDRALAELKRVREEGIRKLEQQRQQQLAASPLPATANNGQLPPTPPFTPPPTLCPNPRV